MKNNEPKEAFPYKAPNDQIKQKYAYIFKLKKPIKERVSKLIFDKIVASILLIFISPLILLLKIAYLFEGWIIPENRGALFFSYNAVSRGKVFRKYKIRIIKKKYINQELAKQGDWKAFSTEWTPNSRTYVGHFVKKFYLDEIPQLYNVWKGDMSIVGPRPLATHHYERDLSQGNVVRSLIKGGLLGLGHVKKGTPEMGNPKYEYQYIEQYLKLSPIGIIWLDLKIIGKGVGVIFKGKGL